MELSEHIQRIAIVKKAIILLPYVKSDSGDESKNQSIVASFQAEAMRLGYIFTQELFDRLCLLQEDEITTLYTQVLAVLQQQKGADKTWQPFYPNFPRQVMQASELELFCNAILHYWSRGHWKPEYIKQSRIPEFEDSKFITLEVGDREQFMGIFTNLLGSNASISDGDKTILSWFVENYGVDLKTHLPDKIPFKEQLCTFGAACIKHDVQLVDQVAKTPTDVLRILVGLSDGDISLASNTKFKSLGRKTRREISRILEGVINRDDIARHGETWKRAFHNLHIGEYQKTAPKTAAIADDLRNGKIRTYYSEIESALQAKDYASAISKLSQRPGELARRLDYFFRVLPTGDSLGLISHFETLTDQIDTRVLLQLLAHFGTRTGISGKRMVLPKGQTGKARILNKTLSPLSDSIVSSICTILEDRLKLRFSEQDKLGKVWVDPFLKKCPVPLSQRSSSDGLITVARGTRLPISDRKTLRMFIWWIGRDVDLSATLYNESFENMGHISYTRLKIDKINSCHSGDITSAPGPDGAAEFIDIDMDEAEKQGCRFVQMSVLDYTGITFAKYGDCCAGWMTRNKPDANEIYDPKTVEQKIDLRTPARLAIPAVFDLKHREAIWMDLSAGVSSRCPNNVESNSATLLEIVEASMNLNNKPGLFELFSLHGEARGELVDDKEDADTIFSLEEGVTPFQIDEILSNYLS